MNKIEFYRIDYRYKIMLWEIFKSIKDNSIIYYEKDDDSYLIKYRKKKIKVYLYNNHYFYKRMLLKDLLNFLESIKVRKDIIQNINDYNSLKNEGKDVSEMVKITNDYFSKFRRNKKIIEFIMNKNNEDYLVFKDQYIQYKDFKKLIRIISSNQRNLLVGPFSVYAGNKTNNPYLLRYVILRRNLKLGDEIENNKKRRNI